MRPPRIIPILCVAAVLLGGVLLAAGAGVAVAVSGAYADSSPSSSPSPSGSPSATPTPNSSGNPSVGPTVAPASPELVRWARHWARLARRDRLRVDRLRRCLGRRAVRAIPVRPSGVSADVWAAYGHRCKRLAKRWFADSKVDLRRILRPRLVSAASWKPLLRYVGWPASQLANAVTCIRRESVGRPWAYNPSGCAGLMQLARCWWAGKFNPYDPEANVRCGLAIWRAEGFRPWVTMAGY